MAVKKFGIVGPADQVAIASTVAASYTGLQPIRLAYGHERETLALIGPQADQVDGWLFTGVVPYELARTAGALQHPARYVSYGRVGFLSSLIRLSLAGVDLSRLSIDTLSELEVRETLADTGLDLDRVSVLPYRAGVTSVEMVDFHRRVNRSVPGTTAITCVASAYLQLRLEQNAVRLSPSTPDVRAAVESLLQATDIKRSRDGNAVLGLIALGADDDDIQRELAALCGEVVRTGPGQYLILTTRGPLEAATDNLSKAPFLTALAARHQEVRMGFGLAGTAAEAASRASKALSRSKMLGPVSVVVRLHDESDLVLEGAHAAEVRPTDYSIMAARTGISRETLLQVRELADRLDGVLLASQVAESFGILPRSARRVLTRLERGGAASGVAMRTSQRAGRPPVGYRILL